MSVRLSALRAGPPLPHINIPRIHFCQTLGWPQGPSCGWKYYVNWKLQWPYPESKPQPTTLLRYVCGCFVTKRKITVLQENSTTVLHTINRFCYLAAHYKPNATEICSSVQTEVWSDSWYFIDNSSNTDALSLMYLNHTEYFFLIPFYLQAVQIL
jgi:hypothetical protein